MNQRIFTLIVTGILLLIPPFVVDAGEFAPMDLEANVRSPILVELSWKEVPEATNGYRLRYWVRGTTRVIPVDVIPDAHNVRGVQDEKRVFQQINVGSGQTYRWDVASLVGGTDTSSEDRSSPPLEFSTPRPPDQGDDTPPPGDGNGGDGGDEGDGEGDGSGDRIFKIENPIKADTLGELVSSIVNFLFTVAILVAPLMVLYAGFLFLTGGSDASKLQQARTVLIWTAVGFGIILIAQGIPRIIQSLL